MIQMRTMIGFKQQQIYQDNALSRLSGGLAFSVLFHVCIALWPTAAQHPQLEAGFLKTHLLQISLNRPDLSGSAFQHSARSEPTEATSSKSSISLANDSAPDPFPYSWIPSVEPVYAAPEDVDEMARVAEVEELPLPDNEQTPSGALYLKILISEAGTPDRIDIMTSTLPDNYAATLVKSFYQAKFSPARSEGLPVRSWRIIEIRFGDTEQASS